MLILNFLGSYLYDQLNPEYQVCFLAFVAIFLLQSAVQKYINHAAMKLQPYINQVRVRSINILSNFLTFLQSVQIMVTTQ